MRDRCAEGTCSHAPRRPEPRPENPEPQIPGPKKSRPQIIMTIRDRTTSVFTCAFEGCNWSRLVTGHSHNAEREALGHLKTHEPEGK